METLESLGWVVLGFLPTMCALEIAWKAGVAKKYKVQVEQEKRSLQMYYSNGLLQIPRKNSNTTLTGRSKDYSKLPSTLLHLLIKIPAKILKDNSFQGKAELSLLCMWVV